MSIDIDTMHIPEAYELYSSKAGQKDKHYNSIRFGVMKKFDIYDYMNGIIKMKSKKGVAIIRNRMIKLEDLHTELEERNRLIKEWLNTNLDDGGIMK